MGSLAALPRSDLRIGVESGSEGLSFRIGLDAQLRVQRDLELPVPSEGRRSPSNPGLDCHGSPGEILTDGIGFDSLVEDGEGFLVFTLIGEQVGKAAAGSDGERTEPLADAFGPRVVVVAAELAAIEPDGLPESSRASPGLSRERLPARGYRRSEAR
jgi:hypothetical protein